MRARKLLGGISRNTIYKLLRTGELASVLIGCRRFISSAAIAEYVARSTTTVSPSLGRLDRAWRANPFSPCRCPLRVDAGLMGLGIDSMRSGALLTRPRHAVLQTSLIRHSTSPTEAGQIGDHGFNASVAQRELRARGRNGFEGRIAKCPRLQQKPSDLLITEFAVIVSCSSAPRREANGLRALCGRESPRARFGVHRNMPGNNSRR